MLRYLWRLWRTTYAASLVAVVELAEVGRLAVDTINTTGPRDFTQKKSRPEFKIDADVFIGRKKLNGGAAMRFAQLTEQLDENAEDPAQFATMLKQLFRLTLSTSSYRRMAERIDATLGAEAQALIDDLDPDVTADDEDEDDDVLDLSTLQEIGSWLLEQYGLRPTEPSLPSSSGQDDQESGTS